MVDSPAKRDYETMLHPDELRTALSVVALYVLAFEMFRDGVIDHLRIMYSSGFDANGWIIDEAEYRANVASRHRSPFQASLLWFRANDALTDADLLVIDELREIRNRLVHSLSELLGTAGIGDAANGFSQLVPIYRKVEIWWIRNFEMAINPDMASVEVSDDEIQPGPMIMLRMLVDTAVGDEKDSWKWYNAFVAERKQQRADPSSHTR